MFVSKQTRSSAELPNPLWHKMAHWVWTRISNEEFEKIEVRFSFVDKPWRILSKKNYQ